MGGGIGIVVCTSWPQAWQHIRRLTENRSGPASTTTTSK
jgi:hypothetical protein